MTYVSYENNVYYNPENYDLEQVGEVSWHQPSYDFDLTVVWRDSKGMFYWASDSGCSCPCPFENTAFDDLERGSKFDAADALQRLQANVEHEAAEWDYYKENATYSGPQVVDLIARIMR